MTSWHLVAIPLVFGCVGGGAVPAAARPNSAPAARAGSAFTPQLAASTHAVSDARMSPNGKWIAYERRFARDYADHRGKRRSELWLVRSTGGEPRRLTTSAATSHSARWRPDGSAIAFLSKRPQHHTEPQLYTMAIDGGEASPLTSVASGVDDFEWSPNGASIAYIATAADSEDWKTAVKSGRDVVVAGAYRRRAQVWLLDVAAGSTRALTDSQTHAWALAWAPDSKRIVVMASANPDPDSEFMHSQLYSVAVADGTSSQLTDHRGKLGGMWNPREGIAWSPDGAAIAFGAAVDESDPSSGTVFVMPATGGAPRALTAEHDGTVQHLQWLDSRTLLVTSEQSTAVTAHRVAVDTGAMTPVRMGDVACYYPRLSADRKRFACATSRWDHPRDVYAGSLGRAPARITDSHPGLAGVALATLETVEWTSGDLQIHGVFAHPPGAGPWPLVVNPHGGPEGNSTATWNSHVQVLVAAGYAVLQPNYRGSTGRGVAFSKADHGDLGGAEFDDVLAGIDHVVAQGWASADRVAIEGWSYGGYFTGWGATKHSSRFRAAIMGAGITNWVSFQGTTDIPREMALVHWALWPYDNVELAWARSPIAHLKTAKTPTLIVHGADDPRVPLGQAQEMYAGLQHVGTDVELVVYPRAEHGLRERAQVEDYLIRLVRWLDRYMN